MILWTSPVEAEESPRFKDMGKRSWRWALKVGFCYVSLYREYSCETSPSWGPTLTYIDLVFRLFYWRFGYSHMYYDCNHHILSFGPIHFCWSD